MFLHTLFFIFTFLGQAWMLAVDQQEKIGSPDIHRAKFISMLNKQEEQYELQIVDTKLVPDTLKRVWYFGPKMNAVVKERLNLLFHYMSKEKLKELKYSDSIRDENSQLVHKVTQADTNRLQELLFESDKVRQPGTIVIHHFLLGSLWRGHGADIFLCNNKKEWLQVDIAALL